MTASTKGKGGELPTLPVWVACRNLLKEQEDEFFRLRSKVLADCSPEDVHDLRVATRRLREGLSLFAPILPSRKANRLDKRIRSTTTLLGALRNSDEAADFFAALPCDETCEVRRARTKLLDRLAKSQRQARKEVLCALEEMAVGKLRKIFREVLGGINLFAAGGQNPFEGMSTFGERGLRERENRVARLLPGAVAEEGKQAQHKLRIAVKKLRYRLEIAAPHTSAGYQLLHERLKGYQDLLGKLHDLDVFVDLLEEQLADGEGRRSLQQAVEKRREELFRLFLERVESTPLNELGEAIATALGA